MNFGINKPKIFDVQTTSFAEILLVILFFLLIFNIDSVEKVTGKEKQITVLTKEVLSLKEIIKQRDQKVIELENKVIELENEIIAWKRKLTLVNKENIKLENENKIIKLENIKLKDKVINYTKIIKDYKIKFGNLIGDDVVNFCRIGNNDVFPVLNILAKKTKLIITPLWNKISDQQYINKIPGLKRIRGLTIINHSDFKKYFRATYDWGVKQEANCRFIVKLKKDKSLTNADDLDSLLQDVDAHFYVRRVK